MKAIVYHNYGSPDVLKCEEIEKPTAGDDEVLIRVCAAAINPVDLLFRGTTYMVRIMTGLRKPKETRIGHDVTGQVEAVGRNVTQFKPGDAVFGTCKGAFAEYVCASESALVLKPENVTFEQAASVPIAALTALQGLRFGGLGDKGQTRPKPNVLINGASGGVGTFAVQIAKSFGADVSGVCSTRNVEMVRSIGADQVIDYTREDFTRTGQRYDLIFQLAGTTPPLAFRRVLTPKGRLVLSSGDSPGREYKPVGRIIKAMLLSPFIGGQTMRPFVAKASSDDLQFLRELIETGRITPVD